MKKIIYVALATALLAGTSNSLQAQGLKGKLEKKLAEKMDANNNKGKSDGVVAPPHKGQFSDDYGISGLYHLWEPWVFIHRKPSARTGKEMEAHTINLDYNPEKMSAHMYFIEGQYDHFEIKTYTGDTYEKTVWNASKIYCSMWRGHREISPSHTEDKRSKGVAFLQIEEGVFAVGEFRYNTKAPWVTIPEESHSYINIMAKDPAKLEGLTQEKVMEMCQKRAEEINEIYRNARAGNIKLPKRRMTEASQVEEAHKFMAEAASTDDQGDWSGQHMYTYVHSSDWGVTYADIQKTEPVKRRLTIIGVGTSTTQPGKCFYQVGYLQQNWNGTKWGPTFFSGFGGGKIHTTCENASEYQ